MSNISDNLKRQLKHENAEYRNDAKKVQKVVNKLKEMNDGHVWSSQFEPLAYQIYEGKYPNGFMRYKLKPIGELFLKAINNSNK